MTTQCDFKPHECVYCLEHQNEEKKACTIEQGLSYCKGCKTIEECDTRFKIVKEQLEYDTAKENRHKRSF